MNDLNPLLRLRSLQELRLRRGRLLELLTQDGFEGWLEETVEAAHGGDAEAAHTLVAWGSALAHLGDQVMPDWEATTADESEVGPGALYLRLLVGPALHRRLSPKVKLEGSGWVRGMTTPMARQFHGREYVSESSRGDDSGVPAAERMRIERERRWARQEALPLDRHPWLQFQRPQHDVIERAYRHDDPRFRARLLERTWLRERDVVLMASLRPSTEAMLITLARSDRWFFREAVRDALCNNPFSPSWLVGSLLPAARRATRHALTRHPDPQLRELAAAWDQRDVA